MKTLSNERKTTIKTKLARRKKDPYKFLKTLGVVGGSTAAGIGASNLIDRLLRKARPGTRFGKVISHGVGAAIPATALLYLMSTHRKKELLEKALKGKK